MNEEEKYLLTASPHRFNFYYCLRTTQKFILPSASGMSLDIFSLPRLLVFRSKLPASVFFETLLKKLHSSLRHINVQAFTGQLVKNIIGKFF